MDILAVVVAVACFLLGLAGTLLPVIPGAPLIWAGMLFYGLITDFQGLPIRFFAGQGLIVAAVMGIDYLATALGSRYSGGSKAAPVGAALGLVAGVILFNLPGLLIGPFAGAFLAELFFGRHPEQAWRSGLGAVIGFLGGIPLKLFLELIMLAWFIFALRAI